MATRGFGRSKATTASPFTAAQEKAIGDIVGNALAQHLKGFMGGDSSAAEALKTAAKPQPKVAAGRQQKPTGCINSFALNNQGVAVPTAVRQFQKGKAGKHTTSNGANWSYDGNGTVTVKFPKNFPSNNAGKTITFPNVG